MEVSDLEKIMVGDSEATESIRRALLDEVDHILLLCDLLKTVDLNRLSVRELITLETKTGLLHNQVSDIGDIVRNKQRQ